jgi:O-antigen ligase
VLGLILLGGGQNIYALSVALLLPGVALILYPPKHGMGKFFDRAVLSFLGVLLLALLPRFYWPDPAWRKEASELLQMDLGWMLSIQPMVSFEGWLLAGAGVAWFYAASSWRINYNGRKWFYVALSGALSILAGWVLKGTLTNTLYPAAEGAERFSFFPEYSQTAAFLAIGGLVTFGFAMSNLRAKLFSPFLGFVASGLCLAALVAGHARLGLFVLFAGMILWYFVQLKFTQANRGLKVGFPLVLAVLIIGVVSNEQSTESSSGPDGQPLGLSGTEPLRASIYADTWSMIQDAPLTGHGLANFDAIFPQYQEASVGNLSVAHPGSGLLWLASEGGLLALVALVACLVAYFRKCRGLADGNSGLYRLIALLAVVVFLLFGLVDVSAYSPGMAYFALLIAACALPKRKDSKFEAVARPGRCRMLGGVFVTFGVVWLFAGVTGLPLHSKVAVERYEAQVQSSLAEGDLEAGVSAARKWLDWRPMDWEAHFQYGRLLLAGRGEFGDPELDFQRARFAEPNFWEVTYQEGLAWLPYDVGQTISAWQATFTRELQDPEGTFSLMLLDAEDNLQLFEGMARLSEMGNGLRYAFLKGQKGSRLMRELNRELAADPTLARFDREQRTSILNNWVMHGDAESAEAFIEKHEHLLNRPWWLRAQLLKNQARFEQAVSLIREFIEPPVVPVVEVDGERLERLVREFSISPQDTMKGTALMSVYIEAEDYGSVFDVVDAMTRAQAEVPHYVLYWKAETLFRFRDFIESWYIFETYLGRVWSEEGEEEPAPPER